MKKVMVVIMIGMMAALSGCVSLTYQEKQNLAMLKHNGITVDRPIGGFEEPNSRLAAGLLNVLPGFGNFYLAVGHGNDSVQCVYGLANIWFWPISIVWAAPQGAIDAGTLNEREMLYYYRYNDYGKKALEERGLKLD
jgi:hypothetical protein